MEDYTFSARQRNRFISALKDQTFDLLVIGGGITGAGIALDAVSRGLNVALVEKRDFAWGTSSRSTKLIHGGLRYLKQLEFGLVHEVGVERAIVHSNAPHVVIPEKMLLPIIEDGSLGKMLSSIGLWVYDRLANVEVDERRKMIEKETVAELEPLLRKDILLGGGLYYEYRTDDARLTIENIKKAVDLGAIVLNYMEVEDFLYKKNAFIGGAKVVDKISGEKFNLKARRVVNAAGPWVDALRNKDKDGIKGKRLFLTKGVHVVVPHEKLPIKQSIYFDVHSDKRMCFAIPRAGITYIGTTDTTYDKEIDHPQTKRADVEYILNAVNYMFPTAKLNISDVESSWSGLRPLIHQDGKSPSELSRKDEMFYSSTGLISIAGGKLTGYRKMAERVVNMVLKTMHIKKKSKTEFLKLSGADFDPAIIQDFIYQKTGESKQLCWKQSDLIRLFYRYGSNIDLIIEKAYEFYPHVEDKGQLMLHAEIWYSIHYEMTNNLNDFYIRRTGKLYFERPSISDEYHLAAEIFAQYLQWDESKKLAEIKAFELEYQSVLSFKH